MSVSLLVGDCRAVLQGLDADSVDTVITDPPYGLSFMSAAWDHDVPGPEHWRAVLRVAKPGAVLLAFGAPRSFHRLACAVEDAGWRLFDCLMWLRSGTYAKNKDFAPDAGSEWLGWGTALRPGWEPIIAATKARCGTFANNARLHGVAGLHIEGCRIATDWSDRSDAWKRSGHSAQPEAAKVAAPPGTGIRCHPGGRWPSNVILDEEASRQLDADVGELKSGFMPAGTQREGLGYQGGLGCEVKHNTIGDTGGPSRFFYCARASTAEKGDGNTHKTVKPLDLMRYLCRLTKTPAGGTVLDPFMGSGSTGVACLAEGRSFIGIDLEEKNVEIARRRIRSIDSLFTRGAA